MRLIDAGAGGETAIGAESFAAAMAAFAPFEPRPLIAVAVSGGPDSMALVLLADRWARAQDGAVLALVIDHRLRPESGADARKAGAWLATRGIAHAILEWTGDKPASGIQAVAREARYRLLAEACAARGVLHLALAHHEDDQAETLLFRRERGSGAHGMAGMPAARSLGPARLIRPLLRWRKPALIETCRAFGQEFVDDPSNRADRFARTALRRRLARDEALRRRLLDERAAAEPVRQDRARRLAGSLGRIAEIRPDGAILLDGAGVAALSGDDRRAVIAAALRTAGGSAFAPSPEAVRRLVDKLDARGFRGASLGGCAVRLWRDRLVICREAARAAPPAPLVPGGARRWDDRFVARLGPGETREPTLGALGARDYSALKRQGAPVLPSALGAALPAFRVADRLVSVPSLGWQDSFAPRVSLGFLPPWPLSAETITVVNR